MGQLSFWFVIPAFELFLLSVQTADHRDGSGKRPEVTTQYLNFCVDKEVLVTAWVAQKISGVEMSGIVQKP